MRHLTRSERLKGERGKEGVGIGLRGIGESEGLRMNRMKHVRALSSDEITQCQSRTLGDTRKYLEILVSKVFHRSLPEFNTVTPKRQVEQGHSMPSQLGGRQWVLD